MKWGRRPSSVWARPPSECGSFPSELSFPSRSLDALGMGDFDDELVRILIFAGMVSRCQPMHICLISGLVNRYY